MEYSKFKKLMVLHKEILDSLVSRKVFLVSDIPGGGLLDNMEMLDRNAKYFREEDSEIFTTLIRSKFLLNYNMPVLINFSKSIGFYSETPSGKNSIESSLMLSRINFMGTDGIRGKIDVNKSKTYLHDFLTENILGFQLIENCSYSFASMLMDEKLLKKNDIIIIGNDGRDRTTDGKLNEAMANGFTAHGLNVNDIGVVPTPFVPQQILKRSLTAGAVLTASHNPSNQNGIKFFLDGKKLLPEGRIGDYTLSAYIYDTYVNKPEFSCRGSYSKVDSINREGMEFLISVLPEDLSAKLEKSVIILDTANGAFTEMAEMTLEKLGLEYISVNDIPDGYNINRNCGVAELEGHKSFSAGEIDFCIPLIKKMFYTASKNTKNDVFGISLDGDGDRGFIAYYDRTKDAVFILDGDKCGFILAEYYIKCIHKAPKEYYFVSTIESDIMVSYSASETLGLNTRIVSVGDKWISTFEKGKLLVGVEVSGHIIVPVVFTNDSGEEVTLLSGNGLLTALMTLTAIKTLDLPPKRILNPFAPGILKTFYCFFIEKDRFYRGSSVWKDDRKIIEAEINKAAVQKKRAFSVKVVFEEKEDINVLYANIFIGKKLAGCIFSRVSGTEDKIAVYVQGMRTMENELYAVGNLINKNHFDKMKNKTRFEFECGEYIIAELKKSNKTSIVELKKNVERLMNMSIDQNDFFGVIHAIKKEERIKVAGEELFLLPGD